MDIVTFKEMMQTKGYALFPHAFQPTVVQQLRDALEQAYPVYKLVHEKAGYTGSTEGGAHHILVCKGAFLDILENFPLLDEIESFLGGRVIINSYAGFDNVKDKSIYVKNIHRDVRSFDREPRMLNMLVMLDDFTIANGGTHLLAGSHLSDVRPEENLFFANAERVEGKAGSVVLFDSRLWHAAGNNQTDQHRRAMTITFTRPYFKQQFDYCRALGYAFCETLPKAVKQLLGFNSRVPAHLEEWYQPLEHRFYKSDQD